MNASKCEGMLHAAGDEIALRTRRSLKRLSRSIYEMTGELFAFGPFAELETRLVALDKSVSALLEELRSMRAEYLKAQLQRLGVSSQSRDLNLHIGCGSQPVEGWINIDNYPAPLSMSALWDLPFADGSAARVFVSRIPASLFYPVEIRRFLSELWRVLSPAGMLQIAVDHGTRRINNHMTREMAYSDWAYGLKHRTRLDYLLDGTAKASCDIDALMHMLVEERFANIELQADGRRDSSYVVACKPRH
jgi:hypothetical protein